MTRLRTIRFAAALAAFAVVCAASADEKPDAKKGGPDLVVGHVADATQAKKAPDMGALFHKKDFDALVKSWEIEKPFAVDFTKQFVVVATSQGSGIDLKTATDGGDLTVTVLGTADLKPGFRYAIRRIDRAGVKTINGKPFPKD